MIATFAVVFAFVAVPFVLGYVHLAKAQGVPKTVYGAVYDENGDLYVGVTVTVNMWTGGVGGVLHGSYVNGPSPDGWYEVIFLDGEWTAGDTIEVIAEKPGGGGQAPPVTVGCDATGSQVVDVHFPTAIPQFGSPALVALVFCAMMLFIFRGTKSRGRSRSAR